jgi:hypothetical protein
MPNHIRWDEDGIATPVKCKSQPFTTGDDDDDDGDISDDEYWPPVEDGSDYLDDESSVDECDVSSDDSINWREMEAKKLVRNNKAHHKRNVDLDCHSDLQSHMKITNEVSEAEYKTFLGRIANYIGWIMDKESISQRLATDMMFEKPTTFIRYLPVLKGDYSLKSGTVYNILLDFIRFAKYMSVFENRETQRAIIVFEEQKKVANKKKKKDIKVRLTVENLEKNLKWPKKGKKELYDLLLKKKKIVDRIIQCAIDADIVLISDACFVNDWTVSLLFIANPQGRSRAIRLMPLDCLSQLKAQQLTTSSELKTQSTFAYQAILCNALTYTYLDMFAQFIRPLLMKSDVCLTLFVNREGKPFQDIGICLTRCFHAISKFHITTTILRSVFETEVDVARENGLLTETEASSVIRSNQHSATTSRDFYLKRRACEEGRNAAIVHDKLYLKVADADSGSGSGVIASPVFHGTRDPPFTPLPSSELSDDDFEDDEGYYLHRPKKARRERNKWSEDELSQLRLWVRKFEHSHGMDIFKDWKACCSAMESTAVFHILHLTPVALREAWRREQLKRAKFYV